VNDAPAFFSRVRLRRDAPIQALAPVLLPDDEDRRIGTAHRLLWTLFADDHTRTRDFLWREVDGERLDRLAFLVLSARPPEDRHRLFEIDPPKPWAPALCSGDRLGFSLRANPVVAQRRAGERGKRQDVVMRALHPMPRGERAAVRAGMVAEKGRDWLASQGRRHGFHPDDGIRVDGYLRRRVVREAGGPVVFSTVDFDGALTVIDPDLFVAAVRRGFGSAKAWGCGLMLIRRLS
jgi:CRISPR system Cascade subunit CasE